ncbi:MAG TPA: TatD family hydrolase [Thermoproteota archaeon]|nr:TatD family hydrolase [Thermoproteota archaeon]
MSHFSSSPVVDVHCHLLDKSFDDDRHDVISRAKSESVVAAIEGTQNLDESRRMLKERTEFWHASAGVHPSFARSEDVTSMLGFIKANAQDIVAVGEIGLDYYPEKNEEEKERMRTVFGSQAELARELDLPVVVHSRSAGRETISLLLEWGVRKAVLHAFDGKASSALEGVKAGYFFSIPPSVSRSLQKRNLVKALPLEAMLLETDSPVLGPTGKERNEPKNVWVSAEAIAELKQVSVKEVAEITTANAAKLFRALRH